MRVVVDTNIFISSFFGGNPAKIIELWREGRIILCLSNGIIDEYMDVLSRMALSGEVELKELLSLFKNGFNCVFTSNTPLLNIVVNDPDDNKFIETAAALDAEIIISGDKHLLSIGGYAGIKIISPGEFISKFFMQLRP
jgi:uncharacterized protein